MQILAWDGILLDAHLWNCEAVDNVLCAKVEIDLTVGWQDELRGNEVVGCVWIVLVKSKGISGGWVNQRRIRMTEGVVLPGIPEIPGELHAGDLNLESGGVRAGVAGSGPEALGADTEKSEEESERKDREGFDERGMNGVRSAAKQKTGKQ